MFLRLKLVLLTLSNTKCIKLCSYLLQYNFFYSNTKGTVLSVPRGMGGFRIKLLILC